MRAVNQYYRALNRGFASGFEPEYQAVLDYAAANSISTPSSAINIRNNNRVKYLKDESLWSKFDLLYFFDQESGKGDFAKINYINPSSYYLYGSNQPDFISDSGFKGNSASGKYFQTGYNPSINAVKLTVDSGMITFRGFDFSTSASSEAILGARTGNNTSQILIYKVGVSPEQAGFRFLDQIAQANYLSSYFNLPTTLCFEGIARNLYRDIPATGTGITRTKGSSFSNLELYLFAYNQSGLVAPTNGGLKYFGIGESVSVSTAPRPIIDTFHEILNDLYTP